MGSSSSVFAAAPTVTGLNPTSGPGGTDVTITGTNFTGATTVKFGSTASLSFTVVSDTEITAFAPGGTGTVDVTVTTPSGTSAINPNDQFTYIPPPTITSISPNQGPTAGGTTVTITGTGFTGATTVGFGFTHATFTVNSDTQITATAPAGTVGPVAVFVITSFGISNEDKTYTYVTTPTITNVSPNGGTVAGGTSVTITGTNLVGATSVNFGATPATSFFYRTGDGAIIAVSPAGSGDVDVRVSNSVGTSPLTPADVFTYFQTPTVTNVNPNSGPGFGGTFLDIIGTNFDGATSVMFGSEPAIPFIVHSPTLITASSPNAHTGTVDVTVTNPGGTSLLNPPFDQFTYLGPTVTNVSPSQGPLAGGTVVTITGTGFSTALNVFFGPDNISFTVNSDTSITVTSPAGTGTVDISVTNADGDSPITPADEFTYLPVPTVTSLSPSQGPQSGGTVVTITGTGFTGGASVKFGTAVATGVTVNSDTSITATSPAGTGTVDVTVITPGGTSALNASDQFTYLAAPTVTNVNPNQGPASGGTTVTITGTGFTGATSVKFGAISATGVIVNSPTSITATSPAGTGMVHVTVTAPGGTSALNASDQFTYTAAVAPTVTNLSPNQGSTSGGTTVTIIGTGFTSVTSVKFGSTNAASFIVNSATSITAVSPAGSVGAVFVTVTTPSGTSAGSASSQFTYQASPSMQPSPPRKFIGKVEKERKRHHKHKYILSMKWKAPKTSLKIAYYNIYFEGKVIKQIKATHPLRLRLHIHSTKHLHKKFKITAVATNHVASEPVHLKVLKAKLVPSETINDVVKTSSK